MSFVFENTIIELLSSQRLTAHGNVPDSERAPNSKWSGCGSMLGSPILQQLIQERRRRKSGWIAPAVTDNQASLGATTGSLARARIT